MKAKDFEAMTADGIKAWITQAQTRKIDIEGKVDMARRKCAEEGVYADADWLTRAEHAAKMTGRDIRIAMDVLSVKTRQEKAEAHKVQIQSQISFERAFMRAAKATLPDETYARLLFLANEMEAA